MISISPALKKVLAGLAALVIVVASIGFLLPSSWRVERSTTVEARPEVVFAIVSSLRTWPSWTSWSAEMDPSAVWTFEGPESGAGAVMRWRGPRAGAGALTIVESDPGTLVRFTIRMEEDAFVARGALMVAPEASGSKARVTWIDEGDFGMNPLVRYFGLAMESAMERELDRQLANLKRYAENDTKREAPTAPAPAP